MDALHAFAKVLLQVVVGVLSTEAEVMAAPRPDGVGIACDLIAKKPSTIPLAVRFQ